MLLRPPEAGVPHPGRRRLSPIMGHVGAHYYAMRRYAQLPGGVPRAPAYSSPHRFPADGSDPSGSRHSPAGATVRSIPRPIVQPADARVGFTAAHAFQILADRREEEMRLLIGAFKVTLEDWHEAIRARETTAVENPDLVLE